MDLLEWLPPLLSWRLKPREREREREKRSIRKFKLEEEWILLCGTE
jgi:hypothetical protein